jgi:hypothetical protein
MEQHAGIDVSLKLSSVCIVDASGKIVELSPAFVCRGSFVSNGQRRGTEVIEY